MQSLFFTISLVLTAVTGLIINAYILMVIILTKQIKSASHILLFHLGTIDIFIAIVFLASFIPGTKEWPPTGALCLLHGFFFTLLQPLTLWTICGLNYDRYYIIAVPLHYSRKITSTKILVAIGTVWMISIFLSAPPIFNIAPYNFIPRLGTCEPHTSSGSGILWYSTIYAAFTLVLPAIFVIFCNIKIFIIARYHRHRIASAIYQVAISAQVAITHQKNPLAVSFGRMAPPPNGPRFHSTLYALLQFVGSFILLYVPHYIIVLLEAVLEVFTNKESTKGVYERHINSYFYTVSSSLLILTVPVNGFLYGLKSKPLRQVLKNYWRKKQTTHDLNQEIQARTPSNCGSRRPSFLVKPENIIGDFQRIVKSPITAQQSPRANTLQVPCNNQGVSLVTEDDIYNKLTQTRKESRFQFLHNFFRSKETDASKIYIPLQCNRHDDSPTILVTKPSSFNSITSKESTTSFQPLLDNEPKVIIMDKGTDNRSH